MSIVLFVIWLILLLPWLFAAPFAITVFAGGATLSKYIFVSSLWSYPLVVGIAAVFRKKFPAVAFLPLMNIVTCVVAGP